MINLKKETVLPFAVVIVLVLTAFIVQNRSMAFMYRTADSILKPLREADTLQEKSLQSILRDTSAKCMIVKSQYETAQKIKVYYRRLSITYYANYYGFSICSIFFTTLLTIAVFLVSNKGWQSSSLILKVLLLTTIFLSSIYYFLPSVLENKENLQKNIEKFVVFQKIESNIVHFSGLMKQSSQATIDSAIASNYNQIASNYDFIVAIDNSKVSFDPTKTLQEINKKAP